MLRANFNINPDFISHFLKNGRTQAINTLQSMVDKTFSLNIDDCEYNLRYDIIDGQIQIFVQKPYISEDDLIKPILSLDFSNNFLPDSIHTDGEEYNPDPMDFVHVIGEQEINDIETTKILNEIQKQGLLQIISKKL